MDNGTLLEAFKYLKYSQLAKNSFVSKRFWNIIRNNRHRLALLYVHNIAMDSYGSDDSRSAVKVFNKQLCGPLSEYSDKQLSAEAYNEWVVRNNYSKQIPIEYQFDRMQSTQYDRTIYEFSAYAMYKDPKYGRNDDITDAFSAKIELNHENWPIFQHFVRLLTDPFIYIQCMQWVPEKEVRSLLSEAISPDRSRLQCEQLVINKLQGNVQNLMSWIKDHVRCTKFLIYGYSSSDCDEELLDFFMTGADCTSEISVSHYDLSKVLIDLAKKFLDLKNCDGYKVVESIVCYEPDQAVKVFDRDYAKFLVNEGCVMDDYRIFEFVNDAIGKKLKVTAKIYWMP
ncbi:hypothetical protein DdX_21021 [Ditylenchus destructor]|uniref:F-box domain-containing protein n=1 Tax=Ditylenchus destructor TaxID=166010 RepID=A0AAD4QRK2_9BILA|nr:hypothetical protein DdX_21021 [Ditylenchus destructor]